MKAWLRSEDTWAVLTGLALVALTAEADRRRMRRAIRTIPVEA